jgi:DNA ligase (NAD+)
VATYRYVGNGIARYNSCSNRGDAANGMDWTEKGRHILPAEIESEVDVDIRGEFTLTGDSHKILGFKNKRNGTSGIMNSGDVEPERLKYVRAYAYQILNPKPGREQINYQFADLLLMKFLVADFALFQITDDLEEVLKDIYQSWEKTLPYDIDGLVLSANEWKNENDKFYPVGKIAYKINSEGVPVTVIGVEWNLSQTRYMKPVVLLDPTEIDGTTVQRATGYNAKYILDNGIKTGTVVSLIKSGKIIPKIIGIVSH